MGYASYIDALDAVILREREEHEVRRANGTPQERKFYVSDFGTCHRRMLLARSGVEGRPRTADELRNLDERSALHDDKIAKLKRAGVVIAGETGTAWTKERQSTRLTDAFPPGFGCRADAVGHKDCECSQAQITLSVYWGKMVRLWDDNPTAARQCRTHLSRHRLDLLEVKTAHANIMNYSARLPRRHNVLQNRAGAWACRNRFDLELYPKLLYFGVGSSSRPLEFSCGGGPEDRYEDVLEEVSTLQAEAAIHAQEDTLPSVKPLMTNDRKEGPERVVFLVSDWECNPLYCPYCVSGDDDYGCCEPNAPINKTGDRIGYLEPDGTTTYVRKWADKVPGYEHQRFAQEIDQPRGKE